MKIGIFLYLPPSTSNTFLLAGGLPRNAITTAVAWQTFLEHEITIVVPKNFESIVKEYVKQMSEDEQKVPNVVSPKLSTLYSWFNSMYGKSPSSYRPEKKTEQRIWDNLAKKWVSYFFSNSPVFAAFLISLFLIVILILLSLLVLSEPQKLIFFLIVISALLTIKKFLEQTLGRIKVLRKVKSRIIRLTSTYSENVKRGPKFSIFQNYIKFIVRFAGEIQNADVKNLTSFGNKLNIDIWWNPSTLFEGVINLRSPIVSTFADFVPLEFPTMFQSNKEFYTLLESSRLICQSSARIVCLSNQVKIEHLNLIDSSFLSKTRVINPGPPTKKFVKGGGISASPSLTPAYKLLKEDFTKSRASYREWWLNPVVIAPTQNRGEYKNLKNLILAIQNLNASGKPTHLVLTCVDYNNKILDFIKQNSCENVVQILPGLTENQIAAVYASCSLAISPSYFEASLPFILYESVAQGKPCLLADIPVTREAMSEFPTVERATLFDPSHHKSISDKIAWALSNQKRLLALQHAFLTEREANFGWSVTSDKFHAIFEEVIKEGTESKK